MLTWVAWWPSTAAAVGAAPVLLAENGATVLGLAWIAIAAGVLAWLARREPPDS